MLRLPGGDTLFGFEVAQEKQHTAQLGAMYRFYPDASTDNADVDGTWEATFTNDEGETSNAILLLEQQHDHVSGSIMTPTGDHRFLEGQVRGDELQLSTFAGGPA